MVTNLQADVCVIGGGPAGAALAGRLRRLEHSVVVVEKEPFPRPHIGESLVSTILPLLDLLDVRAEIENAGFLRPQAAIVRWSNAPERRLNGGDPGFQVDRGRFDQILLRAAEKAGAHVLQPARATRPQPTNDGGWRTTAYADKDGQATEIRIESRFVADASGRPGLLSGVKRRLSRKTLALYGYWLNVPLQGSETRVDAGENEWYWGAPLPGGEFNATVFVDAVRCRAGVASATSLELFYKDLLARSELLAPCLHGSLSGSVRACDATQFYDAAPVAANTIKVGEAAFAIDPLSSQGVQTALGSAVHAAAVVNTILRRPDDTALAVEFYSSRQLASVKVHQSAAAGFYQEAMRSRSGAFWKGRILDRDHAESKQLSLERSALAAQTPVRLASEVYCQTIPILQGDFIVPAAALFSPALSQPIAFLDGILIAPLIAMIQNSIAAAELLQVWSQHIPPERAITIIEWLWENGILCAADQMHPSNTKSTHDRVTPQRSTFGSQ